MSWPFDVRSALFMVGAGEIVQQLTAQVVGWRDVQQLTAQVAFLEDLGSISSTHMAVHDHL